LFSIKRAPPRQNNRVRLRCEALEERETPATFTVNVYTDKPDINLADPAALDEDGNTSVRAAIMQGNALGGTHTVNFSGTVFGTGVHQISITNGRWPTLTASFTFDGPTTAIVSFVPVINLEIGEHRVIRVGAASTTVIKNLTISGGREPTASGGGIWNEGTLTLDACRVTLNSANVGGGIANDKTLTVTNCDISSNSATDGGGIAMAANANCAATISGSQITNNTATVKGGGLSILATAQVTIALGTTITNNVANADQSIGGGIYLSGGTLNMRDSKLEFNQSHGDGGGLYNSGGTATLTNVDVKDNWARWWGGGVYVKVATTNFDRCTFADNAVGEGGGGAKVARKGECTITVTDCTGLAFTDIEDDPR
jgi:hypothetical protein